MTVVRNSVYNAAGFLAPVAVSIVSVPPLISHLGEERYGVLVLVWLITGFLFFFDFGLGLATRYEIARREKQAPETRASVYWTSGIMSTLIGLGGGGVMYFVAWIVFGSVVDMPADSRGEVMDSLVWIALSVPIAAMEGVGIGSLTGQERFLLSNMCKVVGASLAQLLPLLGVLFISPSLELAIIASGIGKIILMLAANILAIRSLGASFIPQFDRSLVRTLLGYGMWSSIGTFGRQMLMNSDRFFIGAIVGAGSVALYSVPMNLMQKAATVPRSVVAAIFPRMAKASDTEFRVLADRATRSNLGVATVMSVGTVFAIGPVIDFWIGHDFGQRVGFVAPLAAITILTTAATQVPAMVMSARGQPRGTTTTFLQQLPPFIAVLYFAASFYGALGAAVAVVLRGFADATIMSWRAKTLGQFFPVLAQTIAFCGAALGVEALMPDLTIMAVAVKFVFTAVCAAWALWLSHDVRRLAWSLVGKFVPIGRSAA